MRKSYRNILILFVFLIGLLVGARFYYKNSLVAVDLNDDSEVDFYIEEGSSGNSIGSILKSKELIKNENIFKLYLKINKVDNLKSGKYSLKRSMDMDQIIEELQKGGKNINLTQFTIPEGYELRQIAEKLESDGLVDREAFMEKTLEKENFESEFIFLRDLDDGQSLEGFLFPSTYEVDINSGEDEIIAIMLREFEKVYYEIILEEINKGDYSLNEIVTLASIIEREARVISEKKKISAVFHNRLKDDMKLQSCATVQYAIGERKEVLSNKDIEIESDYNTYLNRGLPPAPISSVGKDSLLAAIEPEENDFLFFRAKEDGSGEHIFSKTYREHLEADPKKNEVK